MLSIVGIMDLLKDGVSRPVLSRDDTIDSREKNISMKITMFRGDPTRSVVSSTYGYVLPSPQVDENEVIPSDLGIQLLPVFVCSQLVDVEDAIDDFIDLFDNKFQNSIQNRIKSYLSLVDTHNANGGDIENINEDLGIDVDDIPEYVKNEYTYYSKLGKIYSSSIKTQYMEDQYKKMKKKLEGYVTVAFVRGD